MVSVCFMAHFDQVRFCSLNPHQAPPPVKLTHAARTPMTSPEAFWSAALPDAPMPESIRELLRPGAADAEVVKAPSADAEDIRDNNDPPPPMNFNYDDYKASSPSPRNQLAVVATPAKALEHVDDGAASASPPPAVFFLEDAVRVGGTIPFPRGLIPRAAPAGAAGRHHQPPVELYAVRAVRAIEGSSFVVCRGEYHRNAGGAVYGCRGVGLSRAYAVDVAGDGERGDAVAATVVCRAVDDDASNNDGNLERAAASRLLGVKPGGAAVCYAVPDAQMLLVKAA